MSERPSHSSTALVDRPLMRVIAYYVLMVAGTALLWRLFPAMGAVFSADRLDEVAQGFGGAGQPFLPLGNIPISRTVALPIAAALSIVGALLLMVPVSWVYILTRQKKGFRQSVVQTLLILPVVVAGVVLMVKNSIALAFSLAGIVAAVSFRNTLRDTKDAVYIFLAIGVGLAAGVQVLSIGLVLSLVFNVVVVILWWTDFGRAPAHLEGPRAARRLARAQAEANRTGSFISQVDREILKSLSPEQLAALADRARERRGSAESVKAPKPFNARLVIGTDDPAAARRLIEPLLETAVKRWEFAGQTDHHGHRDLSYRVRLKRSVAPSVLAAAIENEAGAAVRAVEVSHGV